MKREEESKQKAELKNQQRKNHRKREEQTEDDQVKEGEGKQDNINIPHHRLLLHKWAYDPLFGSSNKGELICSKLHKQIFVAFQFIIEAQLLWLQDKVSHVLQDYTGLNIYYLQNGCSFKSF